MRIAERPIDTPTMRQLNGASGPPGSTGARGCRVYLFLLTDGDGWRLQRAGISSSGFLAYAVIKAAVFAAKTSDWVSIRRRAEEAVGRDYRWWHHATRQLEAAGIIECQRRRGTKPRYRLRAEIEEAKDDGKTI